MWSHPKRSKVCAEKDQAKNNIGKSFVIIASLRRRQAENSFVKLKANEPRVRRVYMMEVIAVKYIYSLEHIGTASITKNATGSAFFDVQKLADSHGH